MKSWESWVEARDGRRGRLQAAAAALLQGDASLCSASLGGWRFIRRPELLQVVTEQLVKGGFCPTPGQLTAVAGPLQGLSAPHDSWEALPPVQQRAALTDLPATAPRDPESALMWALDELDFFGRQIERRQRGAWRGADYDIEPTQDAATSLMWESWFANTPWDIREQWERSFLPVATRAFSAVLEARQLPSHVRKQVREDLQEAFFFSLLGGTEGTPGWQELVVRVIETSGSGPVDAMAACLEPDGWQRVGSCAVRRGYGPRSAQLVWPDLPNTLARARSLSEDGVGEFESLERFLDVHVAVRLMDTWREEQRSGTARSWRVVLQNRGRASGRLRAVLSSTEPERLRSTLFGLPGLHARTTSAIGRHCKHWAWQQLSRGFSFDYSRSVSAPCVAQADDLPPFTASELRELKAWTVLVMLKGRLRHLTRWVETGSTGDRDTQWGRLLSESLPKNLRDPGGQQRGSYNRLRAELAECLDELLGQLRPSLAQLGEMQGRPSRECKLRFEQVLGPIWVDSIPFPLVRYRGYVNNALETLAWLDPGAE